MGDKKKRKDGLNIVSEFMARNIITAGLKDSVYGLSRAMTARHISCIVVKDGDKIKGIITERDMVGRVVAKLKNPKETPAEEIMTPSILSIPGDTNLMDALKIMRQNKVRSLLVTIGSDAAAGLITQTDITSALYRTMVDKLEEIQTAHRRNQRLLKDSVMALCQTLDVKDHYTETHSKKVARIAMAVCVELKLTKEERKEVYLAGLFHDIGKIHISDRILNKPSPLTASEYNIIKVHPEMSETILKPIDEFKKLLEIIRHHHEWYDGKGYPDNLKGDEIPLGARIITIADSYNAMTTSRPYRGQMTRKKAIGEIVKMSGKQFDPAIVKAFLKALKKNPKF